MGLVHRDLKPHNILMKCDGGGFESSTSAPVGEPLWIAKVCDFGTTKAKMESTAFSHQTRPIGTLMFMAPEAYALEDGDEEPKRFHPMKTDVYSFGLICHAVLIWEPTPFPTEELWNPSVQGFKARVRKGHRPQLPTDCPFRLSTLIKQCWDGNPLMRPNFQNICQELRYIKGLLLAASPNLLDKTIQVNLSQRRVPRFYYFTTIGETQTLVTKLMPTMQVVELHVLCECKMGSHVVVGQEGCEVIIEDQEREIIQSLVVQGKKQICLAIKACPTDVTLKVGNMVSDYNVATVAGSSAGKTPLLPQSSQTVGNSKSYFDYEELYTATNGFSPSTILGEGGFGRVYKGQLLSGKVVAVKQLTVGGGQGDREFRAEVEIISRVHHRHLVSLVGYCIIDSQRLLVYDFVPNGTLADNLHGKKRGLVMDWATRLRVALGSARGLAYLHEDCHPRIIHRDIKASNILLDNNFEAQVADFGLAKAESDAHTHVTTRVMGTFGYLAPEYAASGKLTEKSDVFSFGVVLLELITGRKPVDTRQPPGEDTLVEWAHPLMKLALEDGNVEQLVDPELGNDYEKNEMFRMIEAAAACVCYTASKRPKMSQVVRALESDTENAGLHQGLKPGQIFEHDSNLGGSHFGRGSSDYDTQQYNADMQQFQKLALESQQLGSAYTSNTAGALNGSMANPPSIEQGSNFSSGEAQFDAREQRPVSVRTKTSGAVRGPPIGTSRLANIATGGVQWNFLPRPRYQRQLSSGSSAESSVKSVSIRSDLMTLTPPAPQGYSFGSNWSSEASSVKSGSIKSDLLMRPPPPVPLDYSTGSANYSGEDDDTQFHTAHKADGKPN
ncbi:unnamed protein product [Sphagnum jensenii]|uniref:non-specific serine/threonine protein kinase n=1 Tax=Sphagnum jensenii TaxID=128206 RepID=A0ABP1C2Q0_9BRYO